MRALLRLIITSASRVYSSVRRTAETLIFDRPAGIETTEPVELDALGLAGDDRIGYDPSPWRALRRILRPDEVGAQDCFIDFGCGKGRILLQAAAYPFRRVIGVELSPDLAETARRNVLTSLPSLQCRQVEVVSADALGYEVPDDVTIAYFNNPFHGHIFAAVVDKLLASLRRRPRELRIIYMYPEEERQLLRAGAIQVREVKNFRPTKKWAETTAIRMYKFGIAHGRALNGEQNER